MTHASSCWHREAEGRGMKKTASFFQSLTLNSVKFGLPSPCLSCIHHPAPPDPQHLAGSNQDHQCLRCVNEFYLHNTAPGQGSTKHRQEKHRGNEAHCPSHVVFSQSYQDLVQKPVPSISPSSRNGARARAFENRHLDEISSLHTKTMLENRDVKQIQGKNFAKFSIQQPESTG